VTLRNHVVPAIISLLLVCLMCAGILGSDRPPNGAAPPPETAAKAPERTVPCAVSEMEPCAIRLRGRGAPGVSASCLAEPWSRYVQFTLPDRWADSNGDGWWETVVRISLDPLKECGCARFRLRFDDPVERWALNIGDSPTNNGYGGDDGTTPDSAEVQVMDRVLEVFSAVVPATNGAAERIQEMQLGRLGGREMQLVVCDQSVEVVLSPQPPVAEPLRFKLDTSHSRLLFSLAATGERAGGRGNDHAIHAAFNRVIHVLGAAPDKQRVGSGVTRVEISLTR